RAYAEKAARVAELALDISEVLAALRLEHPLTLPSPPMGERVAESSRGVAERYSQLGEGENPVGPIPRLRVAYHSACSLQHGQRVNREPRALLAAAGFDVVEIPQGHLCCGSAGTYNLLQPELAGTLRERKLANIALTGA